MKVIGQYEKDEVVKFFNKITNIDDYVQNQEIYSHFLHDIFEKHFILYLKNKDFKLYQEYDKAIENNVSYEKFHLYEKAKDKYVTSFHKDRKKFYRYKGKIYSYLYIGGFNIGHIIEIYEYNNNDIANILNSLIAETSNSKKYFFRRLFK